jgi:GTPase Era involved in 16S rRNA processing
VDTPGISESHVEINEAIQKQIEDYLPKATALFFVINSSIGGFSTQVTPYYFTAVSHLVLD